MSSELNAPVFNLALLLTGCVILGKGINLAKLLFPHSLVVRGK